MSAAQTGLALAGLAVSLPALGRLFASHHGENEIWMAANRLVGDADEMAEDHQEEAIGESLMDS